MIDENERMVVVPRPGVGFSSHRAPFPAVGHTIAAAREIERTRARKRLARTVVLREPPSVGSADHP